MIRFGNLTILQRFHLGVYFFLFFQFTVQSVSSPRPLCVVYSVYTRPSIHPLYCDTFFFFHVASTSLQALPQDQLCSIPDYPPISQPLVVILTSQILLYTRWCESNMCIYAPWLCALAIWRILAGLVFTRCGQVTRAEYLIEGAIYIRMRAVL